jgi:hypothetical protein
LNEAFGESFVEKLSGDFFFGFTFKNGPMSWHVSYDHHSFFSFILPSLPSWSPEPCKTQDVSPDSAGWRD